jgi:cytochrome o ubiquinol oxidase subunit IV
MEKDSPTRQNSSDRFRSYVIGLVLAVILTIASFTASSSSAVWGPGIPVLLAVLAIAQMGVHLVFFLHISSAPDSTNNLLALAFGVFVVGLVVFGSLIIMWNLDSNMTMAMPQ